MDTGVHIAASAVAETMGRFMLAHENAFVVPAEALSRDGLDPSHERLLLNAGRATQDQLRCLEAGFRLYWERCQDLSARAPRSWFAPRQTNLLIVTEPRGLPLYLEPFTGTSSTLYSSDLDTHPEYVAALLVHMERLTLLRLIPATIAFNLSYWFDRDAESRANFAAAAGTAQRPDAQAFVALADALQWVDELLHDPLRPPKDPVDEAFVRIEGADLYVPKRLRERFMGLGQVAESAVRSAMTTVAAALVPDTTRANGKLDMLCDWLVESHARVIVHGPNGGTLWTPEHDDPIRVRRMLAEANDAAVASLHADLRVIDERSRDFLSRVSDVESLPRACAVLESSGGTYIDPARRAVVYNLQQSIFDTRAVAAPPYHRLLLGARVMHEWGHIAHAAKIVRVPQEHRTQYTERRAELGESFEHLLRSVPEPFQPALEAELRELAQLGEMPKVLARKTLGRVGDYLANMVSARLIPGEEMQAYVRTNVRHHLDENLGLVSELARHAYEIHYLDLVGLPRDYFYRTSRFVDHFLSTGMLREADVEALFDAVGRVLACYAIDESRLSLAH
ncbi:MAG TPA: hypothetical protein VMK32_07720 [Burkholderiaceae bacterium]|nr:hypothetical protein [Burkholderiaceae bacterium]